MAPFLSVVNLDKKPFALYNNRTKIFEIRTEEHDDTGQEHGSQGQF